MRKESGNFIPMVFVTTSDGKQGIKGISYTVMKSDMRKTVRELKKTLETVSVESSGEDKVDPAAAPEETATSTGSGLLAEEQGWSNVEGNNMRAAVQAFDETTVTFVLPDKTVVDYPLSKLSLESQTVIAGLR